MPVKINTKAHAPYIRPYVWDFVENSNRSMGYGIPQPIHVRKPMIQIKLTFYNNQDSELFMVLMGRRKPCEDVQVSFSEDGCTINVTCTEDEASEIIETFSTISV